MGPPFPYSFHRAVDVQVLKKSLFLLGHQDEMRGYRFHPLDCQDSLKFSLWPSPISSAKKMLWRFTIWSYILWPVAIFLVTRITLIAANKKSVKNCALALDTGRYGKIMWQVDNGVDLIILPCTGEVKQAGEFCTVAHLDSWVISSPQQNRLQSLRHEKYSSCGIPCLLTLLGRVLHPSDLWKRHVLKPAKSQINCLLQWHLRWTLQRGF